MSLLMYLRGGRPVHFLSDWMYSRLPVVGSLLRLGDVIPVYGKPVRWRLWEDERRRAARRPVFDVCLERLGAGASLGFFPEGARNRHPGELLRGRRGLGGLVLRSQVPVVPVGLRFPAARRLGRPPIVGRLALAVGTPLHFAAERALYLGAPAPECPHRRLLVRKVVDRVMDELAALAGKCAAAADQPATFPVGGQLAFPLAGGDKLRPYTRLRIRRSQPPMNSTSTDMEKP